MNPLTSRTSRSSKRNQILSAAAAPVLDQLEDRTLFSGAPIPVLHSNPGAAHTVYLDFDGYSASSYGFNGMTGDATAIGIGWAIGGPVGGLIGGLLHHEEFPAPSTPNFDLNGDPSSLTTSEADAIKEIWARVSEDYSPFNTDVTTQEPATLGDGDVRVSIGGDGDWWNFAGDGVGVPDGWGPTSHEVFVFSNRILSRGYSINDAVTRIADTASHEGAHSFEAYHQATYDAAGNFVNEYNSYGMVDAATGIACKQPLMGSPTPGVRSTWWRGLDHMEGFPWASEGNIQDDMALLSSKLGYRSDDVSNVTLSARALGYDAASRSLLATGRIEQTTDKDVFSFNLPSDGPIEATVRVARWNGKLIANLASKLELRDASGSVVRDATGRALSINSSLSPTDTANDNGLGVTINVPSLRAGQYFLVVSSRDSGGPALTAQSGSTTYSNYGDVGQYTVSVKFTGGARVLSVGRTRANVNFNEPMTLTVRFDRPVISFRAGDVLLTDRAGVRVALTDAAITPVAGTNGTQFQIRLASIPRGGYSLTLGTAITDQFGKTMRTAYSTSYLDSALPQLRSAAVQTGSIRLTFSEKIDPASLAGVVARLTDAFGRPVSFGTLRSLDYTNTAFELPISSTPAGGFDLQLNTTVMDIWGDGLDAARATVTFRDSTGPKILGVQVLNSGSASASSYDSMVASVLALFNEAIDQTTFTASDVRVTDASGNPISVSVSPASAIAGVTPGCGFALSFTRTLATGNFSIQVGPDIRDVYGNRMDQDQDGLIGLNMRDTLRQTTSTFGSSLVGSADLGLDDFLASQEIAQDRFTGTFYLGPVAVLPR